MPRIDLKSLILGLSLVVALLTFGNGFFASYRIQRDLLMDHALESNRVYAAKQAHNAEGLLQAIQQQLAFSASRLAARMTDEAWLEEEVQRLKGQSQSFNSVLMVRADARVLASAPDSLGLTGHILDTPGAREALSRQTPLITEPFIGASGNLLVFISQPIHDEQGRYLGYVGGSLYLHQENILQRLLGRHHYADGSYIYVVDRGRHLIYHQDDARVGERVTGNPVIEAVLRSESGSQRLINSRGVDMLAGYAPVPSTGWGVVAQTPTEVTLNALNRLMGEIVLRATPFSVICLLLIWWMARRIARPLEQLAASAQHWESNSAAEQIGAIRGWYSEAEQLKRSVLNGLALLHMRLGRLNLENVTDALTGLFNRRGMQAAMDGWLMQGAPFSLVLIDIDYFKRVNDQHGHDVGDQVLEFVAQKMRECSRGSDLLCRAGGEEFVILLPGAELDAAVQLAERLRQAVAASISPTGSGLTLSAGVAHWNPGAETTKSLLKRADEALYRAKGEGRNRVLCAEPPATE
ncbi:GGDEF domain-containing protein [Pseudomonas mangrovi]|uniref:diguanylate cyclase n=1 Tax=Pseudomonas mangrovi TaxID=2161748 RepID=A0A2T5P5C4_9PSED|nr:sensor domain-containing diguanylate cyclase [Pseudomonas mangrovi]PTU72931.1 diguanylate cyclase [Pseudomonas mangrovi]